MIDLIVLLVGGDPDMRGVWVPLFEDVRTPSHTILTFPDFEKGRSPPFEGV